MNLLTIKENHKLHRIKDIYKAFLKISMISMKDKTRKWYYAKSTMKEKNGMGETECRFIRRKI